MLACSIQIGAVCFRSSGSGEVIWKERKWVKCCIRATKKYFSNIYVHICTKRDKLNIIIVHEFCSCAFICCCEAAKNVGNHIAVAAVAAVATIKVTRKRQSAPNKIMTIDFRFSLPVQNAHSFLRSHILF